MYAMGITKSRSENKTPKVNITVGGYNFPILVDTGSIINAIDRNTFNRMKDVKLQQTKVKAYPYNTAKPAQFLGKFETVIQTKSRCAVATFFVLNEENKWMSITRKHCPRNGNCKLSLNKMTADVKGKDGETEMKSDDQKINDIVQEYKAVFTGISKLKGYSVKLNVDENAMPQAQSQRRIPFHIRKKVKASVKELESEGIIECHRSQGLIH